jgi:Fe-S oxidoreductase
VDIARLKAEYTAQRYKAAGRTPLSAALFGAVRELNRLGAVAPSLSNWAGRTAIGRAVASLFMGVDPRRSLPQFATPLPRLWDRQGSERAASPVDRGAAPIVALFGDCFTMFNEPGIGLATRRVFEGCGYQVVLADAGCCGRAKISSGLLPQAIDEIDATLDLLRPLIEHGRVAAVLVAEPSCLSAIKDDWLSLKLRTPLEVRRKLAGMAYLPEDFFDRNWDQHPRRPDFTPPSGPVILHGHCHQKALWGADTSARALRRVAGDKLSVLDSGCCGMAGSFGFTKDRYDLSMKIGELALLPAVREAGTRAIIAAPGTSCRHQVHDGAGVRALHPMEIIERAIVSA